MSLEFIYLNSKDIFTIYEKIINFYLKLESATRVHIKNFYDFKVNKK